MTHSAPTSGGTPRAPKTPEHWTAVASLIGAAVSALTFLVGFIGLPAVGVDSPAGASATVTAFVTTTATVTAKASVPSGTSGDEPSPSGSTAIRWSGTLLLTTARYDLDLIPPEQAQATSADILFYSIRDQLEADFESEDVALVPSGETPDAAECTLLAKTQSRQSVFVPAGRSICLITDSGRTAFVAVEEVNAVDETARVTVQVWDKP
ncbi:hypothetical protein OG266_13815 [Streptomyces sp. NBC_00554]|uniref:hypothetical protein n=1 Tax=Streptomyces sp. NBC_00554 TaxID=2903661 RepID=UPI00352D35DE|nr:hypothetical protein OG266_13815 [Streptomyces sp. NBC_00554]